jgi:uncharacterized membrane protein
MHDASIALIAAAASLIGATVGSLVALRIARAQGRERKSSELAAAVAVFGYTVDRLLLEIGQLPPSPGRAATALTTAVARMPHTDWLTGQLARWSLGRPAMRALDGLMAVALARQVSPMLASREPHHSLGPLRNASAPSGDGLEGTLRCSWPLTALCRRRTGDHGDKPGP